jgi:hypothetical protein
MISSCLWLHIELIGRPIALGSDLLLLQVPLCSIDRCSNLRHSFILGLFLSDVVQESSFEVVLTLVSPREFLDLFLQDEVVVNFLEVLLLDKTKDLVDEI